MENTKDKLVAEHMTSRVHNTKYGGSREAVRNRRRNVARGLGCMEMEVYEVRHGTGKRKENGAENTG